VLYIRKMLNVFDTNHSSNNPVSFKLLTIQQQLGLLVVGPYYLLLLFWGFTLNDEMAEYFDLFSQIASSNMIFCSHI